LTGGSAQLRPPKRASPTATEIGLLAVGLAALAFAAAAGGWSLGRGSKSSAVRTVTVGRTATAPAATTHTGATTGNPAAGKVAFVSAGCGSCHTLKAAGAAGTVGPNLDQANLSSSAIIDWVTNGKGNMPSFKAQLSRKQIADLAAFVAQPASR
jgi:mono/diheme cytochrome c family protein